MAASLISISFFVVVVVVFILCSSLPYANSQQADSCNSTLTINNRLPFDATSFNCRPVWNSQGFILRYSRTALNLWSFVLSAPNTNAYVAMGFSPDGNMIGSSAVVGWVGADGTASMRRYYLRGQSPTLVVPDQGNLQVVGNSTSIVSDSSRIYMAFQLNTDRPETRLIYSVGPAGTLPVGPGFRLTEHRDKISTSLNYATGQSSEQEQSPYGSLRRSHGVLNMLGWGILLPIGAIAARHLKQWDPIWFYSHVAIQSLGFFLGVAGVVCGFVLNDRLKNNVDRHKSLGIFILVLGCLQVMAFLARPNKESKVRKYWNWYHQNVGRVLIFLAAANVFYGIHLGNAGSGWNAGFAVVIAVLFIVTVILELRTWMKK